MTRDLMMDTIESMIDTLEDALITDYMNKEVHYSLDELVNILSELEDISKENENKQDSKKGSCSHNKLHKEEDVPVQYSCIVPQHVDVKMIDDVIKQVTSPKYIIMSTKTLNSVFPALTSPVRKDKPMKYHGIKIATCDDLDYGYFEVI